MSLPRRTFLQGIGAAVALPFLDAMVPALRGQRPRAGPPLRRDLRAARRDHEPVDAGDGGRGFEFTPHPEAARAVQRPRRRHQQPERPADVANGGHAVAPRRLLERPQPEADRRRRHPRRDHDRSDHREADRAGHAAAVARGRDRGLQRPRRRLRHRLQLRLHEHDLLGGADDAAADGDQPADVFERLFGKPGSPERRRQRLQENRSILDSVTEAVQRTADGSAPATRRASPTISTTSARSSAGSSGPRSRRQQHPAAGCADRTARALRPSTPR